MGDLFAGESSVTALTRWTLTVVDEPIEITQNTHKRWEGSTNRGKMSNKGKLGGRKGVTGFNRHRVDGDWRFRAKGMRPVYLRES